MNKRCDDCKHFIARSFDIAREERPRIGTCTLYPKWYEVPRDHYCGQWWSNQTLDEAMEGLGL
jgi:hypothetical protein